MKIRSMLVVDKIFNVDIALKFAPPAPPIAQSVWPKNRHSYLLAYKDLSCGFPVASS